jgi:hypothetical protein
MYGKVDVVEAALAINLETMQSEPAEAASHQAAQAAVLVPLLQLTAQQRELISVGMGLYLRPGGCGAHRAAGNQQPDDSSS